MPVYHHLSDEDLESLLYLAFRAGRSCEAAGNYVPTAFKNATFDARALLAHRLQETPRPFFAPFYREEIQHFEDLLGPIATRSSTNFTGTEHARHVFATSLLSRIRHASRPVPPT